MKHFNHLLLTIAQVFLVTFIGCNSKQNERKNSIDSTQTENTVTVPVSVIQFLINSAAKDFKVHQPPIAIDFRNLKAGYILSEKDTTYLISGEFFPQGEKNWVPFETIKTFGYEQYIGNTVYSNKAQFESPVDNNELTVKMRTKWNELNEKSN